MKMKDILSVGKLGAVVPMLMVVTILAAGISHGASVDVYLKAGVTTKTINGAAIAMWGFAQCTDGTFASCGAVSVPGPALTATEGDALNIHLRNDLTGPFTEPVSIVIPGQITAMNPVWIDGLGNVVSTGSRLPGDVTSRVRSFTAETPVGGTSTYTWSNVKSGAYIYQSGTHPAVQVQMGLYGVLEVLPVTPARAYEDPSTAYDARVALLFSEIDPALHNAVATGTYGPPAGPGRMTSTVNYNPAYFLINGEPYTAGLAPIPAGLPGQKVLVRFLNAGLESKVPTLQNQYMTVIAEDGNLYPNPKEQYSVFLPAGKTLDAIMSSASAGYIPVYDRMLNLTSGPASPGGMLRYLEIASLNKYVLTVNKAGSGTGIVEATSLPGGISCGLTCNRAYNEGTMVKLNATPAAGSVFAGWSGACAGTGPTCIVTMDAAKTVTATFNVSGSWITVLSPNGGENFQIGTTQTIRWSYSGTPGTAVHIQLLKGGAIYSTITNSTPIGSGQYNWNIGRYAAGSTYTIKITSTTNSLYTDTSDAAFTISGAGCVYSISPTSIFFPVAGGTGNVNVTASAGCAWTAASNVPWIAITAGATGTGSGTVTYTVFANTGNLRTGTMTIAGKTFTVTQDGSGACTYAIVPTNQIFNAAGGSGSVTVTAPAGCAWTAVSNAAWITVTGGAAGSGNGTVTYSVGANAGGARTGTMTIAGQTFTVNQLAPVACTYSLSPTSQAFLGAGGTGSVAVTAPAGCAWTAASNAAWIAVTGGAGGNGNGTVNYSVAPNAGNQRTGTITIGGQTFTVIQGGVTVSGKILNASGIPIPGVLLTLTGPVTTTTTTDRSGEYQIRGVPDGGYILTPSLTGYGFTPASRSFTVSGNNVEAQNFTGARLR